MTNIVPSRAGDLPDYSPVPFAPRIVPEPWPEPDSSLLRRGRRRPVAFPEKVLAPEWDQWVRDTAKSAGAPPDYVAAPLLAAMASVIGNARVASPWDGWIEPAILWVGIVGDPSSGKSPGSDPVLAMVREIEREIGESFDETYRQWKTDVASAEIIKETWSVKVRDAVKTGADVPIMPQGAIAPPEPERPRIITNDATPERLGSMLAANPKGLFSVRDELSGWLLGFDRYSKGGERSFWIEAFGGRAFTVDRVKAGGSIRIPRLSIGVFGGIQPDRLTSLLFTGDDDGLPARFIWVWPDPLPPVRPTGSPAKDAVMSGLRRLASLRPGETEGGEFPILMRLDPKAADTLQEWRLEHTVAIRGKSGMVESAWGKLPGTLVRIAMILELSTWALLPAGTPEPATISEASLLRALLLVEDYLKPMMDRVYGDAALPQDERNAASLARHIAHNGLTAINVREMSRSARIPGIKDKAAMKAAIGALVEAGWLRQDETPTGGRRRSDFLVNPKVKLLLEKTHG